MTKMNWIDQSGLISKKELDKERVIPKTVVINKPKNSTGNKNENKNK